jgi:hypothetical protein
MNIRQAEPQDVQQMVDVAHYASGLMHRDPSTHDQCGSILCGRGRQWRGGGL